MKATRPASHGIRREHEDEPELGLPEALPAGEQILWQGQPDARQLALRVFHVRKLAVYFAALLVLRVVFLLHEGVPAAQIARSVLLLGLLALTCLGILVVLARLSARSTLYTLTTRRVVMRIGIVLTLSFNIPLRRIAAADLRLGADGRGDLPLTLVAGDRIAWLNLWPHCRPWRLAKPQPMLRSIPRAAAVAQQLVEAWSAVQGQATSPAPQPARLLGRQAAPEVASQPAVAQLTDAVMAGR